MFKYADMFIISFFLGALARAFILKIDYRQFPGYPHSYLIHLMMGVIASALGALAFPVLLEEEYIAITFLTIAAQNFREVRNLERKSLAEIEKDELVEKGGAYIEGIAKLFEARNYLALITALITSIAYYYFSYYGIIIGIIVAYLLHLMMKGPSIGDIAEVKIKELEIDNYNIGVDNNIIMNVGESEALEKWKNEGIAIKIIPKDEDARSTLSNFGQRQAILHDLSILMGVKLDMGLAQFTPLARLSIDRGELNIIFIPQEPDEEFIIKAVRKIPVLESSQKKPLKSKYGKKAAD